MTAEGVAFVERAARRERIATLAALAAVAAAGLAATWAAGERLMMPMPSGAVHAALLFLMWWTMMLAMMLPSAAPAILVYAAMRRTFLAKGNHQPALAVFIAGYAAVWTGFSLAAVTLQLSTHHLVPLTGMMAVTSKLIGGLLLIAAGLYQLTPLKHACLRKCQSPLMFFAHRWRKGSFRLGFSHGLYCLGCCWVLMGLLFYGGVMELTWIAGLALYVAMEKLIPAKSRLATLTGIALIAWGGLTLYTAA